MAGNHRLNELLCNGRVMALFGPVTVAEPEHRFGLLFLEAILDRRSFVMSLFGGIAAAGLGGVGMAQARQTKPAAHEKPSVPAEAPASQDIDETMRAGLDATDAEFAQHPHRPHRPHRHMHYRHPQLVHRRPIKRRPPHYRRRHPHRRNIVR